MKIRLLLVLTFFICALPVLAQSSRYAKVVSDTAHLRELPTATSNSLQELPQETVVKILDEKLPWYVVRIGSRVGWLHGDSLEFINSSDTTRSRTSEATSAPPPITIYQSPPRVERPATTRSPDHSGYIRGPRGGCYYISASGRKVYVDHSMCN